MDGSVSTLKRFENRTIYVLYCIAFIRIQSPGVWKAMIKLKIPIVWPKIVEPAHNAEPTLPVPKIKQNNKGRGQHKEDITNIMKSQAYIISCIQLISFGSQSNFVHLWTSHTFLKQLNERKTVAIPPFPQPSRNTPRITCLQANGLPVPNRGRERCRVAPGNSELQSFRGFNPDIVGLSLADLFIPVTTKRIIFFSKLCWFCLWLKV